MNDISQQKTLLLVIGAGASKEVKLPVGLELRTKIAQALDIRYENGYQKSSGDSAIDDAYRILARAANTQRVDINPFLHSSWRIRDAMPQAISIDNFIDSHRNDKSITTCGKLAIARCILSAEENSALFVDRKQPDPKINFDGVQETWFNAFFQLLTENCQETEIGQRLSRVAIICFNYDRCIEHYLHSALQNYYGINSEKAAQAMSNLKVFHPYGSVGQLPWQNQPDGVDYGTNPSGQSLIRISESIRTFTEGIDPGQSSIIEIRSILKNAKRVVFLGFAFHRQNLQLLFPDRADGKKMMNRPTYATGYGISNADSQEIRRELSLLRAVSHEGFHFRNDLTCAALFREFWRSLSLQS